MWETAKKINFEKEALRYFNYTLDRNPFDPFLYKNLANILYSQKNYQEAVKNYRQVVKINPDCVETYKVLGEAELQIHLRNAAIESF